MDIPRTVRLRLNQIDLPPPARPWCVGLRHLPQSIPTVREEALSLLPLLQPLVVREEPGGATSNARRYILLAGRRTLQLLLEKYSRDHLTWALCVANDAPLPNKDELELLDTLLIKLICRPDPDDLALIATALKSDQVLRSEAGRYVDVTSDAAIGRLVGMSRTAMHRHTTRNRSKIDETDKAAKSVTLDLLQEAEPPPVEQGTSD